MLITELIDLHNDCIVITTKSNCFSFSLLRNTQTEYSKKMIRIFVFFIVIVEIFTSQECVEKSITTASGTFVSSKDYCRGQLIFEDNFDDFDLRKWQHEISLTGSAVSFCRFGKSSKPINE